MSDGDYIPILLVVLLTMLLGFCTTDCAMGEKGTSSGSIAEHEYHPPYTTIHCDDKGHCSTHHHPATYILVVAANDRHVEVNVKRQLYHQLRDGEPVRVSYRTGRFTGHWYNRKIHLYPERW